VDVVQQFVDALAALGLRQTPAAIGRQFHVDRVGVAEQVVHVAEDFLIRAHQEHAEQVVLARLERMQGQRLGDAVAVDVVLDVAVGVAGEVLDNGVHGGRFVEPGERHDGEELADAPDVGQRLEHGEVAKVLTGQALAQALAELGVVPRALLQRGVGIARGGDEQAFGGGALGQADAPGGVACLRVSEGTTGILEALPGRGRRGGIQPPEVVQRRGGVRGGGGRLGGRHALGVDHVGEQHGVVGRHRAPGLGQDRRVRQIRLGADGAQFTHHHVRVLLERVVHRERRARALADVVHGQAAADIDGGDGRAQTDEFGIVARRFLQARCQVAPVGDLRAHVEMQHAQPVERAALAQRLDDGQHLLRGQAELGLLAARVLPRAVTDRGQTHAHPQLGDHAQRRRDFGDERDLGGLFDHDAHLQTQAQADERQADVFAVLVAVADDDAGGRLHQRKHGHQFRLAAGLQADARIVRALEVFQHGALLIHLDRVHSGVAAAVVMAPTGVLEGLAQGVDALAQHIHKAHQQRQRQVGGASRGRHLR